MQTALEGRMPPTGSNATAVFREQSLDRLDDYLDGLQAKETSDGHKDEH